MVKAKAEASTGSAQAIIAANIDLPSLSPTGLLSMAWNKLYDSL
jgi:hypothetical protein